MTHQQRRSAENAIWLCQTCAKLIDNDPQTFTADLLRYWKRDAEAKALSGAGKTAPTAAETQAARKLKMMRPWQGKKVTYAFVRSGRSAELSGRIMGRQETTLFECNENFVTIGTDRGRQSVPLAKIEVCFDDGADRLELQEAIS